MKNLSQACLGALLSAFIMVLGTPLLAQDYDVSLSKSTIANGISDYDVAVPFNITVLNEGNLPVKNIGVVDYVPLGYTFSAADNIGSGWSYDMLTRKATNTITDTLENNEFAVLTLNLRPQANDDDDNWINAAEITGIQSISGVDVGDQDADSMFDDIQGNDLGQDDYDEVAVQIYDLALRKTLVTAQNSYSYGSNVQYMVQIFNQGNIPVQNVRITDYTPEGYVYNQLDNVAEGWQMNGATPFNRITSVIQPGDSVEVFITLELSMMMADGNAWDNYTGIDSAYTVGGVALLNDADSNPASNSISENEVAPNSSDDNNINGGGPRVNEDEDDHDVASLEIFDFALTKAKITAPESYSYRQTVSFSTTVYNQGNQEADTVAIVDYIPCGYIFNAASNNNNWDYDDVTRIARYTFAPAPLPDEDSTINIVLEVGPCYGDSTAWDNYAEIEYVIDTLGNVRDDIDSTPDAIEDNDAGGEPGTSTDNQLDGNGMDDEDDHDPRTIEVVDFALKKTVFSPDTARYGELVTFSIKGYNQGNITMINVDVIDDIPQGYQYNPADNPGWSTDPNEPMWTFTDRIPPGDSVEAFINLVLLQTQDIECEWVNYGELRQIRELTSNGIGNRDDDADSFSFFETEAERTLKPGSPDDDNIFALGTNFGQDQDDHDPAIPRIFDLSLVKEVTTPAPYVFDQLLEFEFTVYNQGALAANSFSVIDYIPDGFSFDVGDQTFPWALDGQTGNATLTMNSVLQPGASTQFSIFLELECVAGGADVWTNAAEIFAATDSLNLSTYDIDSQFDMDPDNDAGGTPGTAEDNLSTDSGNDLDGDGVTDEDDHDREKIDVVDLAIKKSVISNAPYILGDLIEFEIVVFNQGNVALEDVQVIDYISPGFLFLASNNTGWLPSGIDAVYRFSDRLLPGESDTTSIFLVFQQAANPAGREDYINYVEILSANDTLGVSVAADDIDSNPALNTQTERDVELGSSDDDNILSKDKGGEEDDHDPAGIVSFDLSLSKTIRESSPYRYGNILTYDIVVTNQGTVPATNIELNDELGCGLVFLASNEPFWSYNSISREASATIPGMLMAGQSITVSISVRLDYCTETFNALTYNNEVEITRADDENGDPGNDTDSTPDNDNPDEDDQNDAPIPVYDLALTKDALTSPIGIVDGDLVEFTFTAYNQGLEDLNDIEVIDYVPNGFNFNEGDNTGWVAQGSDAVFTISTLASQTDTTFSIFLEYENTGTDFVNYSEVQSAENDMDEDVAEEDADSTPNNNDDPNNQEEPNGPGDGDIDTQGDNGIEDDNDPAAFGSFDLALAKEISNLPNNLKYGDLITYRIKVYNEGTLPAIQIEVKDNLPCGLSYTAVNNGTWNYTASNREAVATLPGILQPGDSASVEIQLALTYCEDDGAYTNVAQITDNETLDDDDPRDDDSTPDNDNPNEDDYDDLFLPVVDLGVDKTVNSTGNLSVGSIVIFGFEVFNQGNTTMEEVTIIDYLPSGFQLDDANWSTTSEGVTRTIEEELLPGESVFTTLQVSVVSANSLADYYNYGELVSAISNGEEVADDDVDSEPGSNTNVEQSVIPGSPDDGNRDGGGPTVNEDEDDHDVSGVNPFGSVGDFVFKDLDNDGFQDASELGVDGVGVTLFTCSGVELRSTVTANGGQYGFDNVISGSYYLVFDISNQNGCIFTLQDNANDASDNDADVNGQTDCFTVVAGVDKDDVDAGLTGLSDIGDFVFEDEDGDGIQDFNEDGIPNVIVNLYDGLGNLVETTATDNQGEYVFEDIPVGEYYLEFLTGDDLFLPTVPFAGNAVTDSDIDGSNGPNTTPVFMLFASSDDLTRDAGFYKCAKVCGLSWYDFDEDNTRDFVENGINGLDVNIYRRNQNGTYSFVEFTLTGADPNTESGDGYFEFCVRPGTYYIEVPLPPYGLVLAQANRGNDNFDNDLASYFGPATSQSFTVSSGGGKCDLGAGFYPMATAGERVWIDSDGDGMRVASEPAVENVLVEVFNASGVKVTEATTNAAGFYDVDYLQQESYFMKFTPPAGYGFTIPLADPSSTDLDSDVDHSNGPNTTRLFSMSPGDHVGDIDAGLSFGVLPVTWNGIDVIEVEDGHKLSWSTATEINSSHFIIERSINNKTFEELGKVVAVGNSTGGDYSFVDNDIRSNGLYTYKVKQVDFDGRFGYSPQAKIEVEGRTDISIFPNPASSQTTLLINTQFDSEVSYSIFDAQGRLMIANNLGFNTAGSQSIDLSVRDFAPGVYSARIKINDEVSVKQLFVIR